MTLNDLERRNCSYFPLFPLNSVAAGAHCVKVVEDVVVKTSTFAISSPDEFLVFLVMVRWYVCAVVKLAACRTFSAR